MKQPRRRKRLGAASLFATASLVLLATSAPALAADDYKGWFGYLDLASAQPTSLDHHFANHVDFASTDVKTRLTLDDDSDLTFRIGVGYGFGKGLGALKVSYWSFDNDQTQSGSLNGGLYPTIFGYGSNGGGMYIYANPVTFTATAKVKASTIDLDYVRPITSGDKVGLHWLAGLRVASWEEDQGFLGNNGVNDYLQAKHFEASGVGLRVGAGADFKLTRHFSIKSSMIFSFLQAETEGRSSQTFGIGGTPSDINQADDDNLSGEIRDFDVKAVWSAGALDYFVGYSVASWNGMVVDPVPSNDGGFFAMGGGDPRSRDSVAFNSLHGGVVWRFGKQK